MKHLLLYKFIIFAISIFCVSLFSIIYTNFLNYKLVILHSNIVFLILIILYTINFIFLSKIFNKYILKITTSILFVSLFHILILFYITIFLSKYLWGELPTYKLFSTYIPHIESLINTLPYSSIYIYMVFVLYILIIFVTFNLFKKYFLEGIISSYYYFRDIKNYPVKDHYKTIIFLMFIITSSLWVFTSKFPALGFHHEPFYSFISGVEYQKKEVSIINIENHNKNAEYLKSITKLELKQNIKKKNIILITVDALRADHLNMYGYKRLTTPFLNSIYKSGKLKKMDYTFSTSASSFGGIIGILQSKRWQFINRQNLNIVDILSKAGYETNFILSGDFTNFYQMKSFFGNNVNFYHDGIHSKGFSLNDDYQIINQFNKININKPSFFYFHLMSVHVAGDINKKFQKYKPFKSKLLSSNDREYYINNYDNGILQMDYIIENIFTKLKDKKILDDSLIIITADHGEALGERGYFGHVKKTYNDQLKIPFLIYGLEDEHLIKSPYLTQEDIMPSVLEYLNIPTPNTWDGISLFTEQKEKVSFHEELDRYYSTIIKNKKHFYKYIYDNITHEEEIYDLNKDIDEKNNLLNIIDKQILNDIRVKTNHAFNISIMDGTNE